MFSGEQSETFLPPRSRRRILMVSVLATVIASLAIADITSKRKDNAFAANANERKTKSGGAKKPQGRRAEISVKPSSLEDR